MLEIRNTKVYNLKETVVACKNAFRTELAEVTDEEFENCIERAGKLARSGSGSTTFRKGILVSFDMKYTQYITKQMQRYHWFEYISSTSMMHRLVSMKVDENCAKYVTRQSVEQLQAYVDLYNHIVKDKVEECEFPLRNGEVIKATTFAECRYYAYMMCIQNTPMGYELWVHVTTNYEQLATMCRQREYHKLKEDWGAFIEMCKGLPYSKELIFTYEKNYEIK